MAGRVSCVEDGTVVRFGNAGEDSMVGRLDGALSLACTVPGAVPASIHVRVSPHIARV